VTSTRSDRLAFLRSLGFADLHHDSHVPFLAHLVGTRRVLASWGCRPALCDAGLFHSVYGTEYFEPHQASDRDAVIAVIGAEAERLAWLWCSMRRRTLDPTRRSVELRDGGRERLTSAEIGDIATLWSADTVEQLERMAPEERAFATGLQSVVDHACARAQRAVAELVARAGAML
jgi:hypothetical protein